MNCPLELWSGLSIRIGNVKIWSVSYLAQSVQMDKIITDQNVWFCVIRVKKIKLQKRKEKNKTYILSFSKLIDRNPWRFEASRLLEWSTLEWLWSIAIQRSPWLLSFKIFIDENAMNLIWKKIKTMVGNTLDPPGLLESYLLRLWFTNLFSTVNS